MGDLRQTHEWAMFLGGHWQKEMPRARGNYPTATRDGLLSVSRFVCHGPDSDGNPVEWWSPHGPWKGWWWSEPLPDLPPPPSWDGAVHQ